MSFQRNKTSVPRGVNGKDRETRTVGTNTRKEDGGEGRVMPRHSGNVREEAPGLAMGPE